MAILTTNYLFCVKFLHQKKVYRNLEIYGDWNLYEFAGLILRSVKFDFDHCCGFYSNLKNMNNSEECYEAFVDYAEEEGEEPDSTEGAKSLKKTLIKDVFELKKKMLFYFDYGDGWEFEVTCTGITDKEFTRTGIIKSEGKAPKQYPRTTKGQQEWELFH